MKLYTSIALAALLGVSSIASVTAGPMSMDHMNKMHTHMQEMNQEMTTIRQIKDPKERRARMQKHLQGMSAMMKDMHKNQPMMSGDDQQAHIQMLEKRVDLLQEMMTQVVEVQTETFSGGGLIETYD